jgi:hypothetical protein
MKASWEAVSIKQAGAVVLRACDPVADGVQGSLRVAEGHIGDRLRPYGVHPSS